VSGRYVVIAIITTCLSLSTVPLRADGAGESPTEADSVFWHNIGFAGAYQDFRFVDEVISPVVYVSSSPYYELFYRGIKNKHRISGIIAFSAFTAVLRDAPPGATMTILNRDGEPYSFLRSLHESDGSRVVLGFEYLWQASTIAHRKIDFYVGGRFDMDATSFYSTDNWSHDIATDADRSWSSDVSLSIGGLIERRFRSNDRLSLGSGITVFSLASRPPYYHPLTSQSSTWAWLPPNEFLRWSTMLSYEFWITRKIGMKTWYQFQYQRVTEPRDFRSVTHTLSLGGAYAF
jgi:hypothetical protein